MIAVRYSVLAFLVSASLCGQVFSQASSPFEEIEVTSSRIPLSIKQLGTSISIMKQSDIEAHGNLSLSTILRQMPGINVSSNGGLGSTTSLRIRGEESYRTLMIVDGLRISDPSSTQVTAQLEHLLSAGVGSVEVLRGPQGLAYGADAGGVVNISSPVINEGHHVDFSAQSGALNTRQYSGGVATGNDSWNLSLQGADFSTNGFNSRSADTVLKDDDGYDNQTLHGRFAWNLSQSIRVELLHRNVSANSEFDGCFDSTTFSTVHECLGKYDLNASRAAIEYISPTMRHSLSYSQTQTDRENFALGISSFSSEGELERWEYLGTFDGLPKAKVVFGLDQERADNNGRDRNNSGLHVEYLSDFSKSLFLTAGLRFDDNDDFGNHTSYRLTGSYLTQLNNNSQLRYRVSVGTGFRAPSPYESAYNRGGFSYPPASLIYLREETSEGYELAIEYSYARVFLQAVYFNQEVDDAITFDLSGFSGYIQDEGKSYSKGLELGAELALNDSFSLNVNATYNDTETVNGLQAIRRPRVLANVGAKYTNVNNHFMLNAFLRFSKDAEDEVFGSRQELEDFSVLDVVASYPLGENLKLFARVENATNAQYQEIVGFNSAERAAYLGLTFALQ